MNKQRVEIAFRIMCEHRPSKIVEVVNEYLSNNEVPEDIKRDLEILKNKMKLVGGFV